MTNSTFKKFAPVLCRNQCISMAWKLIYKLYTIIIQTKSGFSGFTHYSDKVQEFSENN